MKKWNVVVMGVLFVGLPVIGSESESGKSGQQIVEKKASKRESLGAVALKRREIKRHSSASSEEKSSMSSSSEHLKKVTVASYAGYPHNNRDGSQKKNLGRFQEKPDEDGSSFNRSFFGEY